MSKTKTSKGIEPGEPFIGLSVGGFQFPEKALQGPMEPPWSVQAITSEQLIIGALNGQAYYYSRQGNEPMAKNLYAQSRAWVLREKHIPNHPNFVKEIEERTGKIILPDFGVDEREE